jgi:hypothetical protein
MYAAHSGRYVGAQIPNGANCLQAFSPPNSVAYYDTYSDRKCYGRDQDHWNPGIEVAWQAWPVWMSAVVVEEPRGPDSGAHDNCPPAANDESDDRGYKEVPPGHGLGIIGAAIKLRLAQLAHHACWLCRRFGLS